MLRHHIKSCESFLVQHFSLIRDNTCCHARRSESLQDFQLQRNSQLHGSISNHLVAGHEPSVRSSPFMTLSARLRTLRRRGCFESQSDADRNANLGLQGVPEATAGPRRRSGVQPILLHWDARAQSNTETSQLTSELPH